MIAIYARVSTQEQAVNGHSIDEQIERMRKYCEAMNWRGVKPYVDAGFSGANTNRPALQRLIADVQGGKVEKVLVYKLDRLSRSQKDTLYLIEDVFQKNNVGFVSMSENFDTSSAFGIAMIGILSVFAQLEREQIKERMHMGKEARAKSGKYNGGTIPIGYDYANGELTENPFESMQVRELFELTAAGKAPFAIAEEMNKRGFRHKYGEWSENTVRNVLASRVYLGEVRFGGSWIQGTHKPIIPAELFSSAAETLRKRSELHQARGLRLGKANTYLAGLLVCGCCGAKYSKCKYTSIKKSGLRYEYSWFICNSQQRKRDYLVRDPECRNKRWKVDELTEMIFSEIRKLRLEPAIHDAEPDRPDRAAPIADEIKKTDGQISRLLDLYSVGQIPVETLQQKIAALQYQKTALETQLEKIKETPQKLARSDAERLITSFDDVLLLGTFDEIRAVLFDLIERIELDGDDVKIFWNF